MNIDVFTIFLHAIIILITITHYAALMSKLILKRKY